VVYIIYVACGTCQACGMCIVHTVCQNIWLVFLLDHGEVFSWRMCINKGTGLDSFATGICFCYHYYLLHVLYITRTRARITNITDVSTGYRGCCLYCTGELLLFLRKPISLRVSSPARPRLTIDVQRCWGALCFLSVYVFLSDTSSGTGGRSVKSSPPVCGSCELSSHQHKHSQQPSFVHGCCCAQRCWLP